MELVPQFIEAWVKVVFENHPPSSGTRYMNQPNGKHLEVHQAV